MPVLEGLAYPNASDPGLWQEEAQRHANALATEAMWMFAGPSCIRLMCPATQGSAPEAGVKQRLAVCVPPRGKNPREPARPAFDRLVHSLCCR